MSMFDRLLDLLYPPKCVFCSALLQADEQYFCRACGEQLPLAEGGKLCRKGTHFDRCVAPLYYRDMVRQSIHGYKFHGKTWRAATYAALMRPYVQKEFPRLDVVTWMPLTAKGKRKRGYDQAELLARKLAKELHLPCEKLLVKQRDTRQQSKLTQPAERRANVLGAYALHKDAAVRERSILLVDDVITSASTLEEGARVLQNALAGAVHCAAFAQAVGKSQDTSCKTKTEPI